MLLAANGEDALSLFKKEQPNLVILDIMLPKIDGYEVCTEIRKESKVPIIMLTALGDIGDRVMGLELGADDYVMKPFHPKNWKPEFVLFYADRKTKLLLVCRLRTKVF